MLEILSLMACGWRYMYNPTNNLNLLITEWEQRGAADTAVECEDYISRAWQRAEKQNREFKHEQWKCVPADAVYPHTTPKR
jgi:hypothetical protein